MAWEKVRVFGRGRHAKNSIVVMAKRYIFFSKDLSKKMSEYVEVYVDYKNQKLLFKDSDKEEGIKLTSSGHVGRKKISLTSLLRELNISKGCYYAYYDKKEKGVIIDFKKRLGKIV